MRALARLPEEEVAQSLDATRAYNYVEGRAAGESRHKILFNVLFRYRADQGVNRMGKRAGLSKSTYKSLVASAVRIHVSAEVVISSVDAYGIQILRIDLENI